jgi:cholesterol transport system auxiliary component
MTANSSSMTWIAASVLVMMLSGCSIGPAGKSAPRTYVLDPKISFKTPLANPGQTRSGTLLVSVPRARAGFDTPRMAYLLRPHEVSYYAFNQWADTPARMLMRFVVQSMENTGLWRGVVQMPSAARADYQLDSDNLLLEQQFFSKPSRVRMALHVQVVDVRQQRVIDARDFEVFEDAPSDDAYGGVLAINLATARLLEELALWVTAIMAENVKSGG